MSNALPRVILLSALSVGLTACDRAAEATPTTLTTGETGGPTPSEPEPSAPEAPVLDPAGDEDGDGLTNGVEVEGWTVSIERPLGEKENRHVDSDPYVADTNADGIADAETRQRLLDPRAPLGDTDGDGLSDREEIEIWRSRPDALDSDGDSNGNTALYDGMEVTAGTSPTMDDTDGDGLSDFRETIELSQFDPRIANVPVVRIRIEGAMDLGVNAIRTSTKQQVEGTTVELEQSASKERASTDSKSHEVTASVEATASIEAQAGFPSGASVTASASVSASAGYTFNTSNSITESSAKASREAYATAVESMRSDAVELKDGFLGVLLSIENPGIVSYELQNLVVNAMRRDRRNPEQFQSIASLTFVDGVGNATDFASVTLSPDGLVKRRASAVLPANVAMELLSEPENLFFEVGSFELLRDEPDLPRPINFAFLEQETNDRTAFIQVDYGNGNVLRRRVATNVATEGGEFLGVLLVDALEEVLGVGFETQRVTLTAGGERNSVLIGVEEFEDTGGRLQPMGSSIQADETSNSFWIVAGLGGARFDSTMDFEDLRLRGGESAFLHYVSDGDADGLYAHEEYMYGTYDTLEAAQRDGVTDPGDSDADGLGDAFEVKTGWAVGRAGIALVAPYNESAQVYSNPRDEDGDRDGVTDSQEMSAGTDPSNPDTDGDLYCDGSGAGGNYPCAGIDPDPLDPTVTGNTPPRVAALVVRTSGFEATLEVPLSDDQANLRSLEINWGDSQADSISDGLGGSQPQPSKVHSYAAAGSYSVSVVATDAFGKTARGATVVVIDVPTEGLVGEWLLDFAHVEGDRILNTAGGMASDWSDLDGRSEDAIDKNASCLAYSRDRKGNPEGALRFFDSNDHCGDPSAYTNIAIPGRKGIKTGDTWKHAPRLAIDENFTLSAWIQPQRKNETGGWIVGQTSDGYNEAWARLQQGVDVPRGSEAEGRHGSGEKYGVAFVLPAISGDPLVLLSKEQASTSDWGFYAVTVSRSGSTTTATLYRDGIVQDTASAARDFSNPVSAGSSDARVYLACPNDDEYAGFHGSIDDVRIYDRPLSHAEVSLLESL